MTFHNSWRRGGTSALAAEILRDAPLAYWKLDESSGLAQDSSGNGYHMTTVSGITYQDQMLLADSILYPRFGTTTARFSRAGTLGLATPVTGDFTFQCVFMGWTNVPSTQYSLFSFSASGETAATNFQLAPRITTSGELEDLWEYGAGVNEVTTLERHIIPAGRPMHLAFVRDSVNLEYRFYSGGVLLGKKAYANAPSGGGSCATYLGYNTSNTGQFWMGHAAFFSSVIDEERIQAWFRATGLRGL